MSPIITHTGDQQERWLRDYVHTKNAGAEFILPWAVDTFFQAIDGIKKTFTDAELKALLEAHKGLRLLPDHTRLSYLLLHIDTLCKTTDLHTRYGISHSSLETKLRRLDSTQTTALMVWASAFWLGSNCTAAGMDDYIR